MDLKLTGFHHLTAVTADVSVASVPRKATAFNVVPSATVTGVAYRLSSPGTGSDPSVVYQTSAPGVGVVIASVILML